MKVCLSVTVLETMTSMTIEGVSLSLTNTGSRALDMVGHTAKCRAADCSSGHNDKIIEGSAQYYLTHRQTLLLINSVRVDYIYDTILNAYKKIIYN